MLRFSTGAIRFGEKSMTRAEPKLKLWLPLLAALFAISGCSSNGATTRQVVGLADLTLPNDSLAVVVKSVSSSPEAAASNLAGTASPGEFDRADLENLRGSLVDTLRAAMNSRSIDESGPISIYLVVRNHVMATAGLEGAALAAVDWCAARPSGTPIYRELFYVTERRIYFGSPGEIKDRLNRAVVRRVAESVLMLASPNKLDFGLPRKIAGTYVNPNAALATLPQHLRSRSVAKVPSHAVLQFGYIPGSLPVTAWWQSRKSAKSHSCETVLARG
jgi:hypothetical protein